MILLGPLVIFSLFAYAFDTVPFPKISLLNQLGWIWAIFGLLYVATFDPSGCSERRQLWRLLIRDAAGFRRRRSDVFAVGFRARSCQAAISSEESHDASARVEAARRCRRCCVQMKLPGARLFCRERSA